MAKTKTHPTAHPRRLTAEGYRRLVFKKTGKVVPPIAPLQER